jgi:beta-glucanase (GH16 family)
MTWPGFWLLSENAVIDKTGPTLAEYDIVEGYGHDTAGVCKTSHLWNGNPYQRYMDCSSIGLDAASSQKFHTYAVKITPTDTIYYIDDVEALRHPTFEPAKEPMFFLINLGLCVVS